MSEPVDWQANGLEPERPYSARFGDVYRNHGLDGLGGLVQARQIFMGGCDLPQAWQGRAQWRILETGFGLGLNFLATWQAWKADPRRAHLLHYCAIEAYPVSAEDVVRGAQAFPELAGLAQELAAQWQGLLPGFHRIMLDEGQVLLTLCVGDVKAMLRELAFDADSLYLDGFSPDKNPAMWDLHSLKALARCCLRGTRFGTWCVDSEVRARLTQCGFTWKRVPGVPPKWQGLRGEFNPAWAPRNRLTRPMAKHAGQCMVVGAGLAGASVAASLARRGWQVTVLDAAGEPAQGASALPAGVLAAHCSPDDSVLSRLSRGGLRIALQQAAQMLQAGQEWALSGVLEHRVDGSPGLRQGDTGTIWSRPAAADVLRAAGLPDATLALWHQQAGWIKPAAWVRALLRHPLIRFQGHSAVKALRHTEDRWQALDGQGHMLCDADLVVVAAALDSKDLLPGDATPPLQALRGLASWGHHAPLPADGSRTVQALPFPVNGHGNLVPNVPGNQPGEPHFWVMGSTFERDQADPLLSAQELASGHQHNHDKLRGLLPRFAAPVAPQADPFLLAPACDAFVRVRCAAPDRLPLVGPALPEMPGEQEASSLPGLWLCTALGSRGLTLAQLCAELLAARLHGEPWPVEMKLAKALDAQRFA